MVIARRAGIVLRRAHPQDLPRVDEITVICYRPIVESYVAMLGEACCQVVRHDPELTWQERKTGQVHRLFQGHPEWLWVLEEHGEVLGFVTFARFPAQGYGHIDNNGVHPDRGGQGWGQFMVQHVLDHFRRQGLRYVHVDPGLDPAHIPARRAYAAVGFDRPAPTVEYWLPLGHREGRIPRMPRIFRVWAVLSLVLLMGALPPAGEAYRGFDLAVSWSYAAATPPFILPTLPPASEHYKITDGDFRSAISGSLTQSRQGNAEARITGVAELAADTAVAVPCVEFKAAVTAYADPPEAETGRITLTGVDASGGSLVLWDQSFPGMRGRTEMIRQRVCGPWMLKKVALRVEAYAHGQFPLSLYSNLASASVSIFEIAIPYDVDVPILMYHYLDEAWPSPTPAWAGIDNYTPATLRGQIRALLAYGYTPVSLGDFMRARSPVDRRGPGGGPPHAAAGDSPLAWPGSSPPGQVRCSRLAAVAAS